MKKVIWKRGLGFILFLSFTLTTQVHATEYFVTVYNSYVPRNLQIEFGDTVTWINEDPFFPHTVTSDTGAWATGFLFEEGETFSLTFNVLGSFSYHDDGSTANGTITVIGGNTPPSITITNPVDAASFTAPATFSIQADASDTDGSVANVEFFVDGASIGNDATSAPYSAVVSNLFEGTYIISVVASDDSGGTASHFISVTVTNPIISLGAGKIVNGEFQFTASGLVTGKTNVVQASTNLVDWVAIRTNLASSGTFTFTNSQTAGSAYRFYQVIQLP